MAISSQQLKHKLFLLHQNKLFEFTVITIIIFSALVTGAKTYEIGSTMNIVISWLDRLITLFFLVEIIIRLIAEPKLFDFFKKGWNVFDFVIVAVSLIPIDGNESVLIARLLRIFRVLRLVSLIPELRVLISALLKSLPRMGYIALLMFIIFYIYGAIGSVMFEDINPVLWGNISIAMLTLFRVATFEDWTDVMYETMAEYPLSWVFYLTFIFLTAFVFLNMMIGVILDVMQKEHQDDEVCGQEKQGVEIKQKIDRLDEKISRLEKLLVEQKKD